MEGSKAEEYVIEKIIDERVLNRKREFLCVWKGYPEKEDFTWETRRNIGDNDRPLIAYHARIALYEKRQLEGKQLKKTTTKTSETSSVGVSPIPTTSRTKTAAKKQQPKVRLPKIKARISKGSSSSSINDSGVASSIYQSWNLKHIVSVLKDNDNNVSKFIVELDDDSLQYIPVEDANQLWPQEVIAFYERLV